MHWVSLLHSLLHKFITSILLTCDSYYCDDNICCELRSFKYNLIDNFFFSRVLLSMMLSWHQHGFLTPTLNIHILKILFRMKRISLGPVGESMKPLKSYFKRDVGLKSVEPGSTNYQTEHSYFVYINQLVTFQSHYLHSKTVFFCHHQLSFFI
jgi:hypothetical protein